MRSLSGFVLLLALLACGRQPSTPAATYQVRARVIERSGAGADARVTVAHEAIPEFKDRDGKVAGMEAMTMAFGLGPGVEANALQAGTQWQLTFDVRWDAEPALRITAAQPLAPTEPLRLTPAH